MSGFFEFPNPFDASGPHPLAREAAERLMSRLRDGRVASDLCTEALHAPAGGKMFGVLVVEHPGGGQSVLEAFSGMIAGRWEIEGFVPPAFDQVTRAAVEIPGEQVVKALLAREEALRGGDEWTRQEAQEEAEIARHQEERAAMKARHGESRRQRAMRRAALTDAAPTDAAPTDAERERALHALDQESRRDKAEVRLLKERHAVERLAREAERRLRVRRLGAMERLRRYVCRELMKRIHDTYRLVNARGEARALRAFYGRGEPPSGAGDCAAVKLLAAAYARGLRPIALAEFWWGAPPAGGGRLSGVFYPACKDKCGPLLPFMMKGLSVPSPRLFSPAKVIAAALPIVFEDEWIIVVDKPAGLLSVPGKDESVLDSVLARLRASAGGRGQTLLAHRLDLDTSGLLIAARDGETYRALQRQFAAREVDKRYIAWLDGVVEGDEGQIALPLRVNLADRPRQIVDPLHGRAALTTWRVLERTETRTRVALFPATGRTHQLRAHAAHPLGLGAPIVGDRLYGREGPRLLLHAESLAFTHPERRERVRFERPAPF